MKSSKKWLLIFSYWSILVKPETKTHLKNSIMMMQRLNSWSSTCVTAGLTPCSAVVALHLPTPFDTYLHRHPASESKKKLLFRSRIALRVSLQAGEEFRFKRWGDCLSFYFQLLALSGKSLFVKNDSQTFEFVFFRFVVIMLSVVEALKCLTGITFLVAFSCSHEDLL